MLPQLLSEADRSLIERRSGDRRQGERRRPMTPHERVVCVLNVACDELRALVDATTGGSCDRAAGWLERALALTENVEEAQ